MSTIAQVVVSAISGAVIGSLCYGLWLTILMSIYIFLYGSYSIDILILSSINLNEPILTALKVGLIGGSILGFFVGLSMGILKTNTIFRGVLIGIAVTAIILGGLFLLSSILNRDNPIEFGLSLIVFIPIELIKNFWLFIPSAATGAILTKVIERFGNS